MRTPGTTRIGRAVLVWAGFAVLAILNGGFRENVLRPTLGPLTGLYLSTVLLAALILAGTRLYLRYEPVPYTQSEAWLLGMGWTLLTAVFEFGFFVGVMGTPISELVAAYNVLAGEPWILVPLTTLIGPRLLTRHAQ